MDSRIQCATCVRAHAGRMKVSAAGLRPRPVRRPDQSRETDTLASQATPVTPREPLTNSVVAA
jgi:hypothetical protein